MTETLTETAYRTSEFRGNHWDLLKKMGWGVGTRLEEVHHDPDTGKRQKRQTLKIVQVRTWGSGILLDAQGRMICPENPGLDGKDGTGGNVVVHAEWPIGGAVTAVSLNCRDWREMA